MKIWKGYGISLSRLHAVAVATALLLGLFVAVLHGHLGLALGDAVAVAVIGFLIGLVAVLVGFAEIDEGGDL